MIELISNKIFLDNNFEIREYDSPIGIIRILFCDGVAQSITCTKKELRYELCDCFMKLFDVPLSLNTYGENYLVLGGGAFTYPKYYISKYLTKKMDVVEINSECIEYAKKYFYLEELINEYDLENKRLNIIIDDAMNYISNTQNKYDYVLIDLFNGKLPITEIYDEENIGNIKRIINNNSIIAINYIINKNNNFKKNIESLTKLTNNIKIITHNLCFNITEKTGNIIIILSNNDINISDEYDYLDVTNVLIDKE